MSVLGYRCWGIKEEQYLKLHSIHLSTKRVIVSNFGRGGGNISLPFDRVVLEQDTGLRGKNGVSIYDGDIFRNTINGGIWRVNWDKKGAAFWVDSGVAGCSLGEFNWDRSNGEYGFIRKNCEVVGNIHENPELLGGEV